MPLIIKTYECHMCGKKVNHEHESVNDTTAPVCPIDARHGEMSRVYSVPRIGKMATDWTVGKTADQIAGVLANEYDP